MFDVTILSAAQIGWQLLGKAPSLCHWLLRRAFPVSKCKAKFVVEMLGNNTRFSLQSNRPSPALIGLEVRVFNLLPFAVEFSTCRLTASIDSYGVLDTVLNSKHKIPAVGFARLQLHEIGLSDQQSNWVRGLQREFTRIQLTLHWRNSSAIHSWVDQGAFECSAYINKDSTVRPS